MGVSGKLHTLATSLLAKKKQYPLNVILGGPQSWSATFLRREDLLSLPASKLWIVQPIP